MHLLLELCVEPVPAVGRDSRRGLTSAGLEVGEQEVRAVEVSHGVGPQLVDDLQSVDADLSADDARRVDEDLARYAL